MTDRRCSTVPAGKSAPRGTQKPLKQNGLKDVYHTGCSVDTTHFLVGGAGLHHLFAAHEPFRKDESVQEIPDLYCFPFPWNPAPTSLGGSFKDMNLSAYVSVSRYVHLLSSTCVCAYAHTCTYIHVHSCKLCCTMCIYMYVSIYPLVLILTSSFTNSRGLSLNCTNICK